MSLPESTPRLHRSYLYAPGDEPDVMRKALAAGADAVVLDLEDAVAPTRKEEARAHIEAVLDGSRGTDGPDVHVRINRDGDGYSSSDLDAVVKPGLDALRLPKVESAEAVAQLEKDLTRLERRRGLPRQAVRLYVTVESARGVLRIEDTLAASSRIARVALGTTDLLADLGASGEDDDLATLYIRSHLVLVSRALGVGPPIDSVHTDLSDEQALRAQAKRARALGFHGKSLIHPRQLAVAHEVFTPSDDELANAHRVIDAYESAQRSGRSATTVDGRFVDPAVVARARGVIQLRSQQ